MRVPLGRPLEKLLPCDRRRAARWFGSCGRPRALASRVAVCSCVSRTRALAHTQAGEKGGGGECAIWSSGFREIAPRFRVAAPLFRLRSRCPAARRRLSALLFLAFFGYTDMFKGRRACPGPSRERAAPTWRVYYELTQTRPHRASSKRPSRPKPKGNGQPIRTRRSLANGRTVEGASHSTRDRTITHRTTPALRLEE